MYAGALDERLKCVVPVCSVGNYQAYLHVGCCGARSCRGLGSQKRATCSASSPRGRSGCEREQGSIQFWPAEAAKSIERAKAIYNLHDATNSTQAHDHRRQSRLQPTNAGGDV